MSITVMRPGAVVAGRDAINRLRAIAPDVDYECAPIDLQEMLTGISLLNDHPQPASVKACAWRGRDREIYVPAGGDNPIRPVGYSRLIMDIVHGIYRLDETGNRIYGRDRNLEGVERIDTYHEVTDWSAEGHVPTRSRVVELHNVLDLLVRRLAARYPDDYRPLVRGIRIHNREGLDLRLHRTPAGPVVDSTDRSDQPYMVDVTVSDGFLPLDETGRTYPDDMEALYTEALRWCRYVTDGEASARNLLSFWAYPVMESRPHLLWVAHGEGGNGKGIFLSSFQKVFAPWCGTIDVERLSSRGYESADEALHLVGPVWIMDEEADLSGDRSKRVLKRLATGDSFTFRTIGHQSTVFHPWVGYMAATNENIARDATAAFTRRYVMVRMRDGRGEREFDALREWFDAREGAVRLLIASAWQWAVERWSPDHGVSIGGLDDLDEVEIAIVEQIVEQGYAVRSQLGVPNTRRVGKTTLGKLGLRTTRRDGEQAYVVKQESVFAPYRDRMLRAMEEDAAAERERTDRRREERESLPVTDLNALNPLDVDKVAWAQRKRKGGDTSVYVQAGGGSDGKIAYDWKKKTENGGANNLPDPAWTAFAQVPGEGVLIIDWDADHSDDPVYEHGIVRMERDLGRPLGSQEFPMPFLERSARGGLHGAYRVPRNLMEYVKGSAVGASVSGDPSLLVDVKANGGGYVIAAGSRTPLGSYDPVAMPPDGRMPYITQPMWEWLELHGYLGQLPDNYRGPDRSSHKPLVERTGNGAQPSRHMPKDCRFGMIRASATPYPDHGRHDGVRDQAWGLARLCAERGASQAEFDRLMDQVRANAGDHDPKDTERLIKGAAERNGYAYHAR